MGHATWVLINIQLSTFLVLWNEMLKENVGGVRLAVLLLEFIISN